ncbi:MAG: cation acetate symporter [Actinobacteria bacterium]|nr:cation acetate symporter [Actinomycetota bacterium]
MVEITALWMAMGLLAVMLLISWQLRRSSLTTLDFYLANRQVGTFVNACAICGDYFSAASFLGVAAAVYAMGLDGVWFATGFAAGFVLVGLFLAAPLRRAGQFSIPDFLANRYSSQVVRVTAVGVVLVVVLLYLIPQMTGVGLSWQVLVGHGAFGLSPYSTGIIVASVAIVTHSVLGGMRATTWNQAFQFAFLFFTVLLLAGIAIHRGFSYPDAAKRLSQVPLVVPATLSPKELVADRPDGRTNLEAAASVMTPAGYEEVVAGLNRGEGSMEVLLPIPSELDSEDIRFMEPGGGYNRLQQIALVITLLLGTAGLPHIVNRYFTGTSGRAARRSTVWVLGLAGVFYFVAVMLGIAARAELPRLVGASTVNADFVDGIARVPEHALLLLARELGGEPLLGLVAAAALAAIFSTVAGLLIAAAVSWGHDIYEQFINPQASERHRILWGRLAVVCMAAISAMVGMSVAALDRRPNVAIMVTWAFAVAGSGFTPIFVLSVWWKRMTAAGAVAGMLTGTGLALLLVIFDVVARAADWLPAPPFGGFASIVAAPAAAIVGITVSLRTRPSPQASAAWVRMHGTAQERREAVLARLVPTGDER